MESESWQLFDCSAAISAYILCGYFFNRKNNNKVYYYYYYYYLVTWSEKRSALVAAKQLKTSINKFYGCSNLRVIFQSAYRIKSLFPYKDRINRSQLSKVVYKASCWDCQDFYIGKTKRRLHDRKTEHFKSITSSCHASAIADHVTSTGHNFKWDHFDISAKGRTDTHCKIKETLLIGKLKPTLAK